uniref:Gibberellin regulated protein n=1 Tax=Lactuca sativa TaxID=4236 RepID=A0A9R1WWP7_LACSA|nr:hypothetical protein LSAT_V11C800424480 [Lactuca sativa]
MVRVQLNFLVFFIVASMVVIELSIVSIGVYMEIIVLVVNVSQINYNFTCLFVFQARGEECPSTCSVRCSATHHRSQCMDVCVDCCGKGLCAPSGTLGNKDECPCYRDLKTKYGEPKCP